MSHTIEFALFPGTLGLDVTGPLEVFNTASTLTENTGNGKPAYRVRFAAVRKGPVRLSSGLEVIADTDFQEISPADTLLIPGGNDIRRIIKDPDFMAYIGMRSKQVKRIISVCTGAFVLAEAGLLDGKTVTTHWLVADELAQSYPRIKVEADAIFIHESNIYSSAGVTAGIDLALAMIEEDLGVDLALEVARLLVLYYRRPGTQSQFSAPLKAQEAAGKEFLKLHDWLVSNLGREISVKQMADYSAMSERNFARVFKIKTGTTPTKYLEILRLDRAREIMMSGNESLDSIAEISGFGREERLRRAFLRRFRVTPSQYRLHFVNS